MLHHFPSKVKLLVAVLQRRDEEDTTVAAEMMERHGSLVEAFDAWRQYRADRLGLAQLYTVLSAESVDPPHPAHDYFVDRYRNLRTRLIADITGLQAEGRLARSLSPETLASLFIAIMDGLQLQQQLDGDALDADTVLVDLLRALGLAQSWLGASHSPRRKRGRSTRTSPTPAERSPRSISSNSCAVPNAAADQSPAV